MVPLVDVLNAEAENKNNVSCRPTEARRREVMMTEVRLEHGVTALTMVALETNEERRRNLQLPRSDLLRRYGHTTNNHKTYDVVELGTDKIIELAMEYSQLQVAKKETRVSYNAKLGLHYVHVAHSCKYSKMLKSSKRAMISRANPAICISFMRHPCR